MIFICLTPNPPIGGEHLKFIELGSPPLGVRGSNDFSEQTQPLNFKLWILNFLILNLFEVCSLLFAF